MTRLDHNRARTALAKKAGVANDDVTRSPSGAITATRSIPTSPTPRSRASRPPKSSPIAPGWRHVFVPQCQNRGRRRHQGPRLQLGHVRRQRGAGSRQELVAADTPADDWVSAAVVSKGEYGVPAGLVFGYPCRPTARANLAIVEGVKLDAFGQQKFQATLKELEEERDAVRDLLPS